MIDGDEFDGYLLEFPERPDAEPPDRRPSRPSWGALDHARGMGAHVGVGGGNVASAPIEKPLPRSWGGETMLQRTLRLIRAQRAEREEVI